MDDKSPSPRHFGLIGHPITHSQSPRLFAEAHPTTRDTYTLIESDSFEEAFNIFKEKYDAVNVTAPFKELAFEASQRHDSLSALSGAANLLVKIDGEIKSYNTDVEGVMKCIFKAIGKKAEEGSLKDDLSTFSTLVIGMGGAGKAAALASLYLGLKTTITNRTESKALEFINRITRKRTFDISASPYSEIVHSVKENQIIIYTVPIRIEALAQCDFSDKIVLEANYRNPSITPELIKKTTLYIDGKEWLLYQGEATWKIITSC